MEQILALGAWAVIIAGPCIVSLYIGEMLATRRDAQPTALSWQARPVPVEAPRRMSAKVPLRTFGPAAMSDDEVLDAECKRRRCETLSSLADVMDVRDAADAIRQSANLWADPKARAQLEEIADRLSPLAQDVLSQYRNSIEKLRDANDVNDAAMPQMASDAPRVADAAPVMPLWVRAREEALPKTGTREMRSDLEEA